MSQREREKKIRRSFRVWREWEQNVAHLVSTNVSHFGLSLDKHLSYFLVCVLFHSRGKVRFFRTVLLLRMYCTLGRGESERNDKR